ncbi:hypothetical conserved integral membrane protein [Virgisporangium aliadipatigenens]|uniref:Hypothetical conserved integral membrane protein n=1 Tax=Virgisporangium aliadipatigenens TaxID=741659 RepID=A0A8J3YJP2_9ACTN|nr:hypothetical protein [Virgisporangium aliadipatigenens]GIJ45098.1 hypothetical conserved integral membrane protein [Virgisporangium aliadipatigenens]
MTKLMLSLHVIAAIVAIGPVTVAASMFPPAARRAAADPSDARHGAVLRSLHRTCRVYALVGIAVPVFGFATAGMLGVTGDPWVVVSIALTGAAAGVLALVVLPGQERVLAGASVARLGMYTGAFNLLWATVTVLMIIRPGSTTSV